MSRHIGKTLLGKSLLNSIEKVYNLEENILLRLSSVISMTVKEFKIKSAAVTAKVKEGQTELYEVTMEFKPINDADKQNIRLFLENKPAFAFEMGMGVIQEDLVYELEDKGLSLNPNGEDDVDISCSCGSAHKICNHVASVLYELSKEIDKNPLLTFSLRSLKPSELVSEKATNIKSLSDKISLTHKHNSDNKIMEVAEYPAVDIEKIMDLLPTNPTFFDRSDFKSRLKAIYDLALTDAQNIFVANTMPVVRDTNFYLYKSTNGDFRAFITPSNNFMFYLKSKGSRIKLEQSLLNVPLVDESTGQISFIEKEGLDVPADTVLEYFIQFPRIVDPNSTSASCIFLRNAATVAISAIKSNSFLPCIQKVNNDIFKLKYKPNVISNAFFKEYNYIKDTAPENILFDAGTGEVLEAGAEILIDFMTFAIQKLAFLKSSKLKKCTVTDLLTRNQDNPIFQQGKNIAESLNFWFDIMTLTESSITPLVRVEIKENNFYLNLDINIKEDLTEKVVSFKAVMENDEYEYLRPAITSHLMAGSLYMPLLRDMLNSKGLYTPEISSAELVDLLSHLSTVLNRVGIGVVIPKELNNQSSIKIRIKGKTRKNKVNDLNSLFYHEKTSAFNISDLMDFSYEVALGDQVISKEEFEKLLSSAEGIIKYKDQYIVLKPTEAKSLLDKLNKPVPSITSATELLHSALAGSIDNSEFDADDALKRVLDDFLKVEDISLPENLNGTLRPYQERGFKWLYSNTLKGFGSCMADDMGLGKTIQTLSLILKLKEDKKLIHPILVVCPTTLVGNWQKECEKFAPSLKVAIYHGSERVLAPEGCDLVITTYGLLRTDLEKFKQEDWQLVIIDEAQNIKNPDTAQSKAVKALPAYTKIAMTGTPVENRLTELWSIFDFINKGYLGTMSHFQKVYSNSIEKSKDRAKVEKLRMATSPFVLRRLKTDKSVISDLPEKIVIDEYCYLSKEQAALYEKTLETSLGDIDKASGMDRRGHVLKLITALKQICNHPAHYTKGGNLNKELSGKAEKTISIIENIVEQDEKAIIFTQYKEMGDLLNRMVAAELGIESEFFHGTLTREKRDEIVESFQTNPNLKLLIVSLKAGGTGLNLTAANNIIHYDLWWNPAVEDQATDRAYRIGQTQNVNVHRLITIGTFEEKIDEMLKSKKELADLTVTTGEKWITELSTDDLKRIFSLSAF